MPGPKILAIDPGFAATGLAVMELIAGRWRPVEMQCIRTAPPVRKAGVRVADQDSVRIAEATRLIRDIIRLHGTKMAVIELPSGGGKSAMAVRAMALATGMIVTLIELSDIASEWYSPYDTRKAATGSSMASKDEVMAAMEKIFPELAQIKTKAEREHIADALSTFRAAELAGNLVRMAASGAAA